jgi:hypothetical protein
LAKCLKMPFNKIESTFFDQLQVIHSRTLQQYSYC